MYLTKSRFKIGMSCPTKLYYESKPDEFDNKDADMDFNKKQKLQTLLFS